MTEGGTVCHHQHHTSLLDCNKVTAQLHRGPHAPSDGLTKSRNGLWDAEGQGDNAAPNCTVLGDDISGDTKVCEDIKVAGPVGTLG